MTLPRRVRIGVGVAGVVIGVLGIARDDRRIVWVAIGLLGVSALLRLLRQGSPRQSVPR